MPRHPTISSHQKPDGFRLPLPVYLLGITVILAAFLFEIARGHCPVP